MITSWASWARSWWAGCPGVAPGRSARCSSPLASPSKIWRPPITSGARRNRSIAPPPSSLAACVTPGSNRCGRPDRMGRRVASTAGTHAPQGAIALLDGQGREAGAEAGAIEALAALRPVARAVMAADQGVIALVEEVGVAEVEGQRLVAAAVDVGVQSAAVAHREGVARDAFVDHGEPHAVALAQPSRVGEDADRCEWA